MVFCRGCGQEIHESALACPRCGAIQSPLAGPRPAALASGAHWIPVTSLVLGILCIISLFNKSDFHKNAAIGLVTISIIGIVFGVISLSKQKAGKGMAIAGIALSSLSLLVTLSTILK